VIALARRLRPAALTAASVLFAGCGLLPIAPPPPAAVRPCADLHSADRCSAMLTMAAEQLGVRDDEVSSISIDLTETHPPGVTLGGALPTTVLVGVDGKVRKVSMCAGLAIDPWCSETPEWTVGSAVESGYADVPCAGEAPNGCATPLPTVAPDARRGAKQLRIDARAIEVPSVGPYRVRLGEADLPNGVWTEGHATLADRWPDHVRLSSAGIRIEVVSRLVDRPPFDNRYEHGWWAGVEPVDVFLVFEARHVDPGATIEIRDLLVG